MSDRWVLDPFVGYPDGQKRAAERARLPTGCQRSRALLGLARPLPLSRLAAAILAPLQVMAASIKEVRDRIGSVSNTKKITEAMKLVAAAKVRRAQEAVVNGRPFAENLVKVRERQLGAAFSVHEWCQIGFRVLWCIPSCACTVHC